MKPITSCPVCGHGEIVPQTITEQFEYKGQTLYVEDYRIFQCPRCQESIVDPITMEQAEKKIKAFHRRVDGLLTPEEIKNIRKALGISQMVFGQLLGGGAKGFARYESGAILQSRAMDNLLRVIREKPETIEFLKNMREETAKEKA